MSDAPDSSGPRRRRVLLAGLALVAVLALAVGAGGFDDLDLRTSGDTGGQEADQQAAPPSASPDGPPQGNESVELSPWYVLVFFGVFVVAALLVGWRRDPRTAAAILLAGVAAMLLLAMLGAGGAVLDEGDGGTVDNRSTDRNTSFGGQGEGTEGTAPAPTSLPMALLLLLGLAIAVGAILGFSGDDVETDGEPEPDEAADEERVAQVGAAAGRAAEELAESGLENAVYRAWVDMTDALDVPNRAATTPAEFRDRALAAGFPADPVSTLTTLFREVRYGDAPTIPEREDGAREALREIEAAADALTTGGAATATGGDARTPDDATATGGEGAADVARSEPHESPAEDETPDGTPDTGEDDRGADR
jgi:uncharacterized membrane protein